MFKKLRIKFIAITMVMVAVVMALAFTVVCVVEYQRSLSVVQTALSDAVQHVGNEGMGPRRFGDAGLEFRGQGSQKPFRDENGQVIQNGMSESASGDAGATAGGAETRLDAPVASEVGQQAAEGESGVTPEDAEANGAAPIEGDASNGADNGEGATSGDVAANEFTPPEIGNRRDQPRGSNSLIPVAVYRSDESGQPVLVPQATSAAISADLLEDALSQAERSGDGFGTFGDLGLHYYRITRDNGTFYAFADTSYTDSWKTLAVMLLVVGLATLVVFFVISLFYSRWALRPVREAWDSQRQFVADASHDLKTPLTVILANSAILLKHPERSIASESQWVESTQKEAENMQGLVNEMLELAQIEAGEKVEVEKNPIDLSDLVDGETLMFDAVALERNCAFDCDIAQGVHIVGNEKQVVKMVSTLVENAFKYVDEGGEVAISLRSSGRSAVLSIRNTGSVISPEDLPHIFDRFYRTDKARTSGEGGYGLGLAIAREIARQHEGDITCASDEATGTTFTITLPLSG